MDKNNGFEHQLWHLELQIWVEMLSSWCLVKSDGLKNYRYESVWSLASPWHPLDCIIPCKNNSTTNKKLKCPKNQGYCQVYGRGWSHVRAAVWMLPFRNGALSSCRCHWLTHLASADIHAQQNTRHKTASAEAWCPNKQQCLRPICSTLFAWPGPNPCRPLESPSNPTVGNPNWEDGVYIPGLRPTMP